MTHTESLFKTILLLQHLAELQNTENIDIYYIDLFCGAGGTSTGVELATINWHSIAKVIALRRKATKPLEVLSDIVRGCVRCKLIIK